MCAVWREVPEGRSSRSYFQVQLATRRANGRPSCQGCPRVLHPEIGTSGFRASACCSFKASSCPVSRLTLSGVVAFTDSTSGQSWHWTGSSFLLKFDKNGLMSRLVQTVRRSAIERPGVCSHVRRLRLPRSAFLEMPCLAFTAGPYMRCSSGSVEISRFDV
ncbi:hypothetical protein M011DRAFT_61919 [Sporormia fimetaria CBS 119925]|uniref:Uncharacterized protein n=1 Tax=Sporormia fimetaria CBS 119925 TaxID=1340428 RepID=A0A6A6VB05_9PLEO|nr:hypothetical protein M011DRAFT_61919 [Sporormia fimetaria CBS 119925]